MIRRRVVAFMEPRQWWERNTVLAEAFCRSDEQVRSAQASLDEAQVHRSRLLAAFAVTVGSDGAAAGVLGLNEREVRVARRTVGRAEARGVADEVLTAAAMALEDGQPPAEAVTAPEAAAAQPAGAPGVPGPVYETGGPAPEVYADPMAYQYYAHPHAYDQQQPHAYDQQQLYQQQSYQQQQQQSHYQHHPQNQAQLPLQTQHQSPSPLQQQPQSPAQPHSPQQPSRETRWTGAMDALLVGSWQTGVDLQVLAAEFHLDLARLISRAQQLSAEGRLSPPWAGPGPGGEARSGRHRRGSAGLDDAYDFHDSYGHIVHPGGWEVPSTVPDDMVAGVGRQSGLPHYTHSTVS